PLSSPLGAANDPTPPHGPRGRRSPRHIPQQALPTARHRRCRLHPYRRLPPHPRLRPHRLHPPPDQEGGRRMTPPVSTSGSNELVERCCGAVFGGVVGNAV